jgi:glycosyltransferase involved in cell wall biosynthesis
MRVELAPGDEVLDHVSIHAIRTRLRGAFHEFRPSGITSLHSHVFPWFIEWCDAMKAESLWVHTYHLPYFPEHARGEMQPWQHEINESLVNVARNAHVRISVSRWQQEWLRENHGIETVYLPNGVDIGLCDLARPGRFASLTSARNYVLYVGRADEVKNPGDFVRLAARVPSMQFVMIGDGLSTEVLMDRFDVATPANLSVLGGAPHATIMDAIAACSALVVTSKREGLPTLVLEAMALGKPIVVPNEPGCVEAVNDGEFGFIYEPGNIEDLAARTLEAIADTRRNMRSRERVLEEYDWRVVAPKLDAIYRGGMPASS